MGDLHDRTMRFASEACRILGNFKQQKQIAAEYQHSALKHQEAQTHAESTALLTHVKDEVSDTAME